MTPIVSYMPCRDIPSKIHHCVKYWPKGYHYSFTRACFALQRRLLSNNKVLSLVLYLLESAASPQKKDIYVHRVVYWTWNPRAPKVEKWALFFRCWQLVWVQSPKCIHQFVVYMEPLTHCRVLGNGRSSFQDFLHKESGHSTLGSIHNLKQMGHF